MKKTLLILAALLCGCFALKAQDFTFDGLNYRVTGTTPPTVELTGHTEGFTAHDFVIPSAVTYDGTSYSVTSIGDYAFYQCSGFNGSLTIGNSVESIGNYAFYGCSGFTGSLTIPNSVTNIAAAVFAGCSGFTGSLTIPNSVKSIGNYAFYLCSGFTGSLTIGSSVTSIGYDAFNQCSGFTGTLTIGDAVTSIGYDAFNQCSGFTGSLTIPNSVTSIGYRAFYECSGFTHIIAKPTTPPDLGDGAFSNMAESLSITVPCGKGDVYKNKTGWSSFSDIITEGSFDHDLTVASANPELGTASITTYPDCDGSATVTATPTGINRFTGWTENGEVVSTANPYTFTLTNDRNLVANFQECTYAYGPIMSLPSPIDPDAIYHLGYQAGNDYYLHTSGTEAGQMELSKNPENPVEYKLHNITGGVGAYISGNMYLRIDTEGVSHVTFNPFSQTPFSLSIVNGDISSAAAPGYTVGHDDDNIITVHTGTGTGEGNLRFFAANGTIKPLYHIAVSATPEGAGTATAIMGGVPVESAAEGTSITVTATPNEGYKFINWTENGEEVSTSSTYTFTLENDRDLVANFAVRQTYHITISATPEGAGTATATAGGEQVESAFEGTEITVTAEPVDGYKFTNWTENGEEVSTKNTFTFTLESDRNLVANFFKQYDFSAICETGQTLYYRIIDEEQHFVSIVAPNGDNSWECYKGYARPIGNISLPETVSHNEISYTVKEIGDCAFCDCEGLTGSVSIPNSVTSIGSHAFAYCWGFNGSLTIPNSVTSIGESAFEGASFTGTLTIPNSITRIEDWAFSGTGFTGPLIIPNSVKSIGEHAFHWCVFTGSLVIPNSVESIERSAFSKCLRFNGSLIIPNSVTNIGGYAFYDCYGFNGTLVIPDYVTTIEEGAFWDCTGFTGLTIGESVENIHKEAFINCNFDNIISKAQTPPSIGAYIPDASKNVYIPVGKTSSYEQAWNTGLPDENKYNFIESDGSPCRFIGTSSNAWNDASNWENGKMATESTPNTFIDANCELDVEASVGSVTVAAGKTLTVNTGKILTADGIILEEGAQLINNGIVASNDLSMRKSIAGYGTGTGNWYLVSSPVATASLPAGMQTVTEEGPDYVLQTYDLYRFDQTGDEEGREWLNFRAESFGIENQRGYLYANKNNTTILFRGGFADTETKTLAYDANADFAGFNLVGNPYPCNATISGTGLRSSNYFYKMNALGTDLEVVANPVLAPCTGVFAVAANSDAAVTFTQASASANVTRGEKNSLNDIRVELLASGKTIDRAFLNMNGESLPKFRLQDNNSEICFYQNKEELAVVSADATRGEMPLNFKAAKNGSYTISVNVENVDAEYLHLIDNLTGTDTDLLATPSYSFEAKASDYASRFKLVFGVKDDTSAGSVSSGFAYISNGEIIVSNEGRATLQVIDVLGRIVSSQQIEGDCRISTQGMTAGLYILNLDGMTQKIVVK